MINPDLKKYVDDARAAGQADDAIRATLVGGGWAEAQVDEALKDSPAATQPPSAPAPAAGQTPNLAVKKKNLLMLVVGFIIVMLIVGAAVAYFLIQRAAVPTFG